MQKTALEMRAVFVFYIRPYSDLDFDIDAGGQIQTHEHVNGLGIRIQNIDHPVVCADFEMFVGILIDEGRAANREFFDFCRKGNRTDNLSTAAFSSVNNPFRRLIQNAMVECLQTDANFLLCHVKPLLMR